MFGGIGAVTPDVFVKTDSVETAQMLINAGVAVEAQYFHRSWVKMHSARARTGFGTGHILEAGSLQPDQGAALLDPFECC
jgi:hypothetical protein